MSDTPQGPGWWQASDAKWHPPEQAPGVAPPPAPAPPPGYGPPPAPGALPYGSTPGYGPPPQQYGAPPMGYAPVVAQGMSGCLKAFLVVLALGVLLLVVGGIAAVFLIDDAVDEFRDGDADEADDVRGIECDLDAQGDLHATVTVRNDSSERSNYIIEVAWADGDGTLLTTSTAVIDAVQPGQRGEGSAVTVTDPPADGDVDCDVTAVQRFSDQTAGG